MKKSILYLLTTMVLLGGCSKNSSPSTSIPTSSTVISTSVDYREDVKEVDQIVTDELKGCFDFMYETAVTEEGSSAYGLIPDRYNVRTNKSGAFASIASVGFGLASLPTGVENEWITKEEGYERTLKTLDNLLNNVERVNGFYFHFLNMTNGRRYGKVEVSVIDTAILVCGALTAGRYFGGECEQKAYELYADVDWSLYYDEGTMMFYMGYSPENGFSGAWDHCAEQLMVYVLAAGSPVEEHRVSSDAYKVMLSKTKKCNSLGNYEGYYMSWHGSIFTYQFSHAFIDFRNIVDYKGVNWFDNSVNASKAAIDYAVIKSTEYKTYSDRSWGFTACDGPNGYSGEYGFAPNAYGKVAKLDGTVPPCGAIGSIPFTPEASIRAMKNYATYENLWSKYGFVDAYNLGPVGEDQTPWYASDVIGIDKGISALMIENYMSEMIWNIFMDINYIQDGLNELGFTSRV